MESRMGGISGGELLANAGEGVEGTGSMEPLLILAAAALHLAAVSFGARAEELVAEPSAIPADGYQGWLPRFPGHIQSPFRP
jgi:hypothetical protein